MVREWLVAEGQSMEVWRRAGAHLDQARLPRAGPRTRISDCSRVSVSQRTWPHARSAGWRGRCAAGTARRVGGLRAAAAVM